MPSGWQLQLLAWMERFTRHHVPRPGDVKATDTTPASAPEQQLRPRALPSHRMLSCSRNQTIAVLTQVGSTSQSTISVFKNAVMLTNIQDSKHMLRAMTNGGHQDSNMIGDFPNLGEVCGTTASQLQTYCCLQMCTRSAASLWSLTTNLPCTFTGSMAR